MNREKEELDYFSHFESIFEELSIWVQTKEGMNMDTYIHTHTYTNTYIHKWS